MKKRIIIGAVVLVVAIIIGVGVVLFMSRGGEPSAEESPAQTKTEQKKEEPKPKPSSSSSTSDRKKKENKREAERNTDKKFSALIDEGNKNLLSDRTKADRAFQEALDIARTDEQRFKAWSGRGMVAKLLENGDVENIAAQNMMKLAKSDREMANALEASADAAKNLQDYQTAVTRYRDAVDYHLKNNNIKMAWTALVEASRIMRRNIGDYKGADEALQRAGDIVEKSSGMSESESKQAKFTICVERADTSRLLGDRDGQLKWNREAVKYNPSWQQTVDMIEREIKAQMQDVEKSAEKENES